VGHVLIALLEAVSNCAPTILVHQLPVMCRLEKKEDGSIDFFYKSPDGQTKCMNAGLVLFGTGRKPIVHDMGLEVLFCSVMPHPHFTPCLFIWSHPVMCHLALVYTSAALQQLYIPSDSDLSVSGTGLLTSYLHVGIASLCHRSLCSPSALWNHAVESCKYRLSCGWMALQDVGVGLDKDNAIKVDPYSRTTVDNIWSVGDVTNRMPLTPAAIMEGMAFAATCFGNKPTTPIFDKVRSISTHCAVVHGHNALPSLLCHQLMEGSRDSK